MYVNESTDLQHATCDELIEELLSRSGFRGLICWQKDDCHGGRDESTEWRWQSRQCDPAAVTAQIAEYLNS